MSEVGSTKHAMQNYVYILQSCTDSTKHYVGKTNNIKRRIRQHNEEPTSGYTKKYGPWLIKVVIEFDDSSKANIFEKYLKTPSGKAFLKKHFL